MSKNRPPRVALITGGARSGKSSHALSLAEYTDNKVFVATAEPFDQEMRDRIKKHREERSHEFRTIEESLDLAGVVRTLNPVPEIVIIDCVTVWLGNLMNKYGEDLFLRKEVEGFIDGLASPPCNIIVVSNELGMGIVPENRMARRFRDLAGLLNQRVAQIADDVTLMVSGLPVKIKEHSK